MERQFQINVTSQPAESSTATTTTRLWNEPEEFLLIETYSRSYHELEGIRSDFEKGDTYLVMLKEFNKENEVQGRLPRIATQIKSIWNHMVMTFKADFVKYNTTGEAGDPPSELYYKMFAVLGDQPTVNPPDTYSSHSRMFIHNILNREESSPAAASSPPPPTSFGEHARPSLPEELEPPTSRRRMVDPTASPSLPPLSNELSGLEGVLTRISDRTEDRHDRQFREYMDMHLSSTNTFIVAIKNRMHYCKEMLSKHMNC